MAIRCIQSAVPYDSSVYLVLGSERTMLVDTGTGLDSGMADRVRAALARRPLDMIVLTHCHYDHVGGADALAHAFGCPVFAGEHDAPRIRDADSRYVLSGMFGGSTPPMDVIDLKEGEVVDLGDRRFTVMWTPGHTEGGICLYDPEAGALISGDTLFSNGVGRTDFPGGSFTSLRDSLARLSNLDIRELYPGHGSMCQWDRSMTERVLKMVGV